MRKKWLPIIFWIILILGFSQLWFKNISPVDVNGDEVIWVLDARFYEFRQQKNWSKFRVTGNLNSLRWASDQYRLIDQPQLGKYLYGFLIDSFGFHPWELNQTQSLYNDFAKEQLKLGPLNQLGAEYQNLGQTIYFLRLIGSVLGLLGIVVFGVGVFFITKSYLIGGLSSSLLFLHPTLHYWYRLAVPNNIQILIIIIALGLMLFQMNKEQNLSIKRILMWILIGVCIAGATAIKLNGIFLLAAPVFIWVMQEFRLVFFQKDAFTRLIYQLKSFLAVVFGFVTTFYFIESELWFDPLFSLKLLFNARLVQHSRFLMFSENFSFFETILFLFSQFLDITSLIFIKIILIVLVIYGGLKITKKSSDKKWFNLGMLMIYLLITNTYYANVGFDRYAEWSIFVFSLLTAIGVADLLKNIYLKVRLKWGK